LVRKTTLESRRFEAAAAAAVIDDPQARLRFRESGGIWRQKDAFSIDERAESAQACKLVAKRPASC
jgi:hypothetical protein